MKLRPTIFLSGVSSEFRTFRDEVEVEIQKKGCFAENQSSFHPDYRTVEAMLGHDCKRQTQLFTLLASTAEGS